MTFCQSHQCRIWCKTRSWRFLTDRKLPAFGKCSNGSPRPFHLCGLATGSMETASRFDLLPRELLRYDPPDVMLRPLIPGNMEGLASYQPPDSLLFPAQSTEDLPPGYPKRCGPTRGERPLVPAKVRNSDAWRVQSSRTPGGLLQQDYAQIG